MRKRFLSMLLCTTLLGTSLAGCGQKSTASSESGDPETVSAPTSETPEDKGTTGTNTFVEGGTEMALWTFQELHVDFYTEMADKWNETHPDKPINLTVTTGESSAVLTKLLVALQSGRQKNRFFRS